MRRFRVLSPIFKRRYNSTEYDPSLSKSTLSILKSLDRSIKEFTAKMHSEDLCEDDRNQAHQDLFRAETLKKMFMDPKLQNAPPYVPPTPLEMYQKLQNQGIEEHDFIPPWGAVGIQENHRNRIFFQSISHLNDSDGWKIQFGLVKNKTSFLRTQNEKNVVFPNELAAVAAMGEWETQKEYLRSTSLPLTNLFCKVQDMKDFPGGKAKVKHEILQFFTSGEHICHREGVTDDVREEIEDYWDPIVDWFNTEYDTKLRIFDGDFFKTDPAQPEAKEAFEKQIDKFSVYELAAIHEIAPITESVVIAIALVKGFLDYKQAFRASQLLTLYNTNLGGIVYGDHDLLFASKNTRFCTIEFFLQLIKHN